jgi:hypothetical protein
VFVGYKLSNNKNDNSINNNKNNNNGNVEVEKGFSLSEAEKLMDKYSYFTWCNKEYIDDLTNETLKSELAINHTLKTEGYNCDLVYGNNYENGVYYNEAFACTEDEAQWPGPLACKP